jgi:rhodanese-related sulfurtransferase
MHPHLPDQKPPFAAKATTLLWQMFGILAASILIGLAYNNASPLGLRSESPSEPFKIESPRTERLNPSPTNVAVASIPPPLATNSRIIAATPTPPLVTNTAQPVATPMKFPELKWPEVKALLSAKKIVLVDARLKANYDISHIPGAISLPATSTAPELQAFATAYPRDTHFVTYCGSDSCHMSRALAESLVKICGYTNVSEMPGGFAEFIIAEPNGGTRAQ